MKSTPQSVIHIISHWGGCVGNDTKSLIRLRELGKEQVTPVFWREINLNGHTLGIHDTSDFISTEVDFGSSPVLAIPSEGWSGLGKLYNRFAVFAWGSKMNVGTRAAFLIEGSNIKRSYRLPDGCSVFPAEILRVLKAAELSDYRRGLKLILGDYIVKLCWVSGHSAQVT